MRKIFHPSAKLLANELNIDKSFKSMHKSFWKIIKNLVREDWIMKKILERGITIF